MKQLINDKWSFAKLPCGSTAEDAAHAVFEPVDLPHDWLIWQENLYESADAWYRREIELEADGNNSVMLRFDGVYMDCDVLLNDEVIRRIAERHGVSSAQVILRWDLQRGIVVIPGSSNPEHIRENLDLFGFRLTDEEMEEIRSLDRHEKHDWY